MAAKQTSKFPDINILKQFAESELIHALEAMPGNKDLFIDPDLMRPIDKFAGTSVLKKHGVAKIYKMAPGIELAGGCHQRMFLVRSNIVTTKYIADNINKDKDHKRKHSYKILMVPRQLTVCLKVLENEGVLGDVSVDNLGLNMFVLDTDLITLELPNLIRSFFLEGDETWLHTVATALITLQELFGKIPNIRFIGRASHIVGKIMEYIESCKPSKTKSTQDVQIGHLFIIDRDVDYMTALCSQVTFEGILDETFGINSGIMEFAADASAGDKVKVFLSSQDPVYCEARDKHVTHVFAYLNSKIGETKQAYNKRHGLSLGDMKSYVGQELRGIVKQHSTLENLIKASEIMFAKRKKHDFQETLATERNIMAMGDVKESIEAIEECINRQLSYHTAIRLLCLLSLTCGGIPSRDYKSLMTQFLHSHGFEHMLSWHKLKKVGLLKEQDTSTPTSSISSLVVTKRSSYVTITKKLNLVPNMDVELKNPTDMSYVFGGMYAPLTCSLVENGLLNHTYSGLEEALKTLPCQVTIRPPQPVHAPRVALVCFVGGCTYAETAALRFLSVKLGYQFLVITTSMVNSSSLIDRILEGVPH